MSEAGPGPDLAHHGDVEVRGSGLLDLAVNVHPLGPPPWLVEALRDAVDDVTHYPDPTPAEAALARLHGRAEGEVLATAGAAEAFTLVARLRRWRHPVVVHPQFTEPHAALLQAGHRVQAVLTRPETGHALEPEAIPTDADLVVVGNPTNPTGVLHPAALLRSLRAPGRVVVVDEAFMDAVPGEPESLASDELEGLVVVRSLTKTWAIPGVRAGYLLANPSLRDELARLRTPWSVSSAASAAALAVTTTQGRAEQLRRARQLQAWRRDLTADLAAVGVGLEVPSQAPFVLARVGCGVHARLRERGVAVRRCDTFPGLDDTVVRIATRPRPMTEVLLRELVGIAAC
ncbi:Rv2231c family pyridoxal phosphate-dependent protein CobC [Nocardioides acrostichi]|uniref:Rv2231c family pyridoxal phosphate-dependent protein CobC n=1 Tax=Nocardioides acrostichi TaxID=2784339 RepID=UPI002E29C06F|nr:Rv2231c family pyridoxal phosphate-dependent protein CobC [Nocardioides acrostichi]